MTDGGAHDGEQPRPVPEKSPSRWFRIDPDEPIFPEPGKRHGSAMAIIDMQARILLQQRDDPQPPEGYGRWAIPGGGLDAGETPRQCAVREILEETGLVAEQPRYFASVEVERHHDGKGSLTIHMFFSRQDVDPADVQVNEGIDMRFWSEEEARQLRINPNGREWLDRFLDSDQYQLSTGKRRHTAAAAVIALDRWGRVLLQQRDRDLPVELHPSLWGLTGGGMERHESPDQAALREFEEETGHLLDEVRLFRSFTKADIAEQQVEIVHVYFSDPDLELAELDVLEGQALGYFAASDLGELELVPHVRPILEQFFESPAYRALFH